MNEIITAKIKSFSNGQRKYEEKKAIKNGFNSLNDYILSKTKKNEHNTNSPSFNTSPTQKQIDKLLNYFSKNQYDNAKASALNLLNKFPNHQLSWKVLGIIYNNSNQKVEALEACQKAVNLNYSDAEAISNLGVAYMELGRYQEALESLKSSIHINSKSSQVHYNLGIVYQKLDKFEEAEENYKNSIQINEKHYQALNNLGVLLRKKKQLKNALIRHKEAITIKPDFAEGHYNIGIIHKELNNYEEAIISFSESIKYNPYSFDTNTNLGDALLKRGKLDEAEVVFRKALKINPTVPESYYNLADVLKRTGKFEEAILNYRKSIELKPKFLKAYNNLGVALMDLGKLEAAKSTFNQAININANNARIYYNMSSLASNVAEAQIMIDKSLNVDDGYLKSKFMKAALQIYEGNNSFYENLIKSKYGKHEFVQSLSWILSLPKLPKIYFNKWQFFDAIVKETILTRPFYEFGVWRGTSFKYLKNFYKKGYGFDTFTGLPEIWDLGKTIENIGTYSVDGQVPNIDGGQFIVGKFEDTLPQFFKTKRSKSSLINIDCDLYSSTICALNYSKPVIDNKTIIIFDELIINPNWQNHEFKALNEFCSVNDFSYDVISVSLFTKQVAVKIKK